MLGQSLTALRVGTADFTDRAGWDWKRSAHTVPREPSTPGATPLPRRDRPLDGKHNGGDGRGSSLYHGIRPTRRAERYAASAGDRSPMTCGSGQRRCRRSMPHGNGLDGDGRLRSGSLHGRASALRPGPKPGMDEHCLSGSGTLLSVLTRKG